MTRSAGLRPLLLPDDANGLIAALRHLDDSEVLRQKTLLEEELRALKAQLNKADNDRFHAGVYAPRDWYLSAQQRRVTLARHVQLLQAELGSRRELRKRSNIQLASHITRLRYTALRHVLHAVLSVEQLALIDSMTNARVAELEALGDNAPRLTSADRIGIDVGDASSAGAARREGGS